jgi:large subunit ribosomal protein L18
MKGILDGGVSMPVSEESLPDQQRISGQHIADYAGTLKGNQEEYKSRFSAILKNGLSPEDYPSHFEEIKSKLSGKPVEKPAAPKKVANEEEEAPAHKEKKEAPAKEEKKAPKEKKETKKKEAKEEKGKGKKAKGGKSKKK